MHSITYTYYYHYIQPLTSTQYLLADLHKSYLLFHLQADDHCEWYIRLQTNTKQQLKIPTGRTWTKLLLCCSKWKRRRSTSTQQTRMLHTRNSVWERSGLSLIESTSNFSLYSRMSNSTCVRSKCEKIERDERQRDYAENFGLGLKSVPVEGMHLHRAMIISVTNIDAHLWREVKKKKWNKINDTKKKNMKPTRSTRVRSEW